MTHDEKKAQYWERAKIVSLYILYLKGKMETFPYTRRELKKALSTILTAANKHEKYMEHRHFLKIEEESAEEKRIEDDKMFDTRHLFPDFKN